MVVDGHWHSDHVRGIRVFDEVPIVGTTRMRELMIEDASETLEEFSRRAVAVREFAHGPAASATTPDQKLQAAQTAALAEALAAEADGYRLVLPDVLIGDRLDIEGARRRTILSFGRGHTASDLFLHLPDDRIVIAADLVWTGIHPETSDGFPAEWADVLDRVEALEPDVVVPDHGQLGSTADIVGMTDYLRQLDAMVIEAASGALDPAGADPPSGSEGWQDVSHFRHGLAALAGRSR